MSGFQTNLLTGLGTYLASEIDGVVFSAAGNYTDEQTGIVLGNIPQSPDRIITLTCYGGTDDPSLPRSAVSLQVRTRWGGQDKRPVDDLDDAVYSVLHASRHLVIGTGEELVHIVQCQRKSQTTLGQDVSGRWSDSSNYDVTVLRPSANRT